jgi:uncharacterized protein (TIGR03437 family)
VPKKKGLFVKTASILSIFLLLTAVAFAQPSVVSVSNAASFVSAVPQGESGDTALPNSSIAQGSFFVVIGNNLASSTASLWGNYPLPTKLNNTSIAITVGGSTTNAIIYYAGPSGSKTAACSGSSVPGCSNGSLAVNSQINAVMPSNTPTGSGTLVVTYNGQASSAFPVTVIASSFGTFAVNEGGTGPGVFFNIDPKTGAPTLNTLFNSATPGQVITLYGTGLGPAPNPATEGQSAPCPTGCDFRNSNFAVQVWVGNQQATVEYAGRSGYTAEDQINFTVPANATGCYNGVAVYAGPTGNQTVSNFTSIAVAANGGACSDVDASNLSDVASAINSKGKANIGVISLTSNYLLLSLGGGVITEPWDNDNVDATFATYTSSQLNASLGLGLVPSVNSCTVTPFFGLNPVPTDPILSSVTFLDAGSTLSAKGPSGAACASASPSCDPASIPKEANGEGYGTLVGGAYITCPASKPGCPSLLGGNPSPDFFRDSSHNVVAGTSTVTGPGGSSIGAFSASINVAAPLTWNDSILNNPIPRNTPLNITWSGGDPNGFVDITGIASTYIGGGEPSAATPGVIFECIAPTSAGSFTVPTVVLSALPSTAASVSAGGLIPTGYLLVGPASKLEPVTPTPSGLDAAYIYYHFIQGANAVWK